MYFMIASKGAFPISCLLEKRIYVPFKSHIKLAGPKQTHCVPFSLILPTHCITRLDFLCIHNCYDYYYYYYYYYYMVALVIREKNYMAFANFIYAHTYTYYIHAPNVIRLQRQFHFERSLRVDQHDTSI